MKVEAVVENGEYIGIEVVVPPGIELGDDHMALLEYRAARHALDAMCGHGQGIVPTDALTPEAQYMVEINALIARYYEENRPDIVENFQAMRRHGDALGWESRVSLTDAGGAPIPIFTFEL